MRAMLKSDWNKGLVAGAVATIVAMAAVTAIPELVSQTTATAVQKELRHIHLDQAASSAPAIEQRYLKWSSAGPDDGRAIDDLVVGDRLTIGGKDGLKSVLEIVSVTTAAMPGAWTTDGAQSLLKVVMARDLEVPSRPLVRLIFDAGADGDEGITKLGQAQRAL